MKVTTLRLSVEQAEALKTVADIDGITVSEAIRDAVQEHIVARASDKQFLARLAASIDRDRRILNRLEASDDPP